MHASQTSDMSNDPRAQADETAARIPIFLFVNPSSGGCKGEKILRRLQRSNDFEVELSSGKVASLRAFNLKGEGPGGIEEGFRELNHEIKIASARAARQYIRVISAGGDGTLKWVVGVALQRGIDPWRDLLLGVLPLGTGNDFSRSTGWGGKCPRRLLSGNFDRLAALVRQWCIAVDRPHDVWKIHVEVDESDGKFFSVNEDERRKESWNKTELSEFMTMYFSIGIESKVGMGFDKNRSNNRLCNFLVYALEGLKKANPCRRHPRIGQCIVGLYRGESDRGTVVFDNWMHEDSEDVSRLVSNPEMLAVLNIASYGGGLADFWSTANRLGVTRPVDNSLLNIEQDPGDGRLEVVTVRNLSTVACDGCFRKTCLKCLGARRVCSGAPLYIEFADGEDMIAYCQIDGEFFKLVNPVSATIKIAFRLRVLYNKSFVGFEVVADESDESSGSDTEEDEDYDDSSYLASSWRTGKMGSDEEDEAHPHENGDRRAY